MQNKYWLRVNDENMGPYDIDELIELKAQDSDYVWTTGMDDWTQLAIINDFQIVKSQKVTSTFSLWLKYFILIFLGLFCLSFIYNFMQLPLYERDFGGKNGLDIIGEVAFDDTPLSVKAPASSFYILFLLVLVTTILYSIIKSKWDTRQPIYLACVLMMSIPLILFIYEPNEKKDIRPFKKEKRTIPKRVRTAKNIISKRQNIGPATAVIKNASTPPKKDVEVKNKSMYAIIVYSVQDSETGELYPNFSPIFMIDSEITYQEESDLLNKKIKLIQNKKRSQVILHKQLKAFESKGSANLYIDYFKNSTFYREATEITFDSIASYVLERSLEEISKNQSIR